MSQQETPLISVITPTYNRVHLLSETIDSILIQEYLNFEYIILDDGSTDDTPALLERYATEPRLRWTRHDNMGETYTVNKGFEMARGEYVVVVNSDDLILPGYMQKMVAFMQANPNLLAAYPAYLHIDFESQPIEEKTMYDYDYIKMMRWYYNFIGPGALIRRRAFQHVPGRDPALRYRGDHDFWMRLGLYGPIGYMPEVLATWRSHPGGTTSNTNPGVIQEVVDVAERFYKRNDLPPEVQAIKRESLGNAYRMAAISCRSMDPGWARRLMIRAVVYDPLAPLHYPDPYSPIKQFLLTLMIIFIPNIAIEAAFAINRRLRSLKDSIKSVIAKGKQSKYV